MIVDHRTYTLHPGKLKEYVERYEREGKAIQTRHLGQPVGWYTSMDIGELNQVVHLWGYDSLEDRAKRRAAMSADPEWLAFVAKQMSLVQRQENKILSPAVFPAKQG
jgi:hypothetical protein